MQWRGGVMGAFRGNQFAALQGFDRLLHGALGKAGGIREHSDAGRNWLPATARGLAVEVKVNEIGGWLLVVADNVA